MTPKGLAQMLLLLLIVAVSLPLSWIAYGWDRLLHKHAHAECNGFRLHMKSHGR